MISLQDLKKIEQSTYYDEFRRGVNNLCAKLLKLINDPLMDKNGENSISPENMEMLGYYRTYLRSLIYGESDLEKERALQYLQGFPAFLSGRAFQEQVNSPTILERMFEVEALSTLQKPQDLEQNLRFMVRNLELDLTPELSVEKLGSNRKEWTVSAAAKLPTREEAQPGSWAALYYSLTKSSAKPNPYKDASVYEHKCSDNTMIRLYAATKMLEKKGGEPALDKRGLSYQAAELRKDPWAVLTLRNEHTVELLRRGNLSDVAARVKQTRDAFIFQSKQELTDAKARASRIRNQMEKMEGKAASSAEFKELVKALKEFGNAEWNDGKSEKYSANVLMAVENFTKGRKNVQRSAGAQECVNLALDALVSVVPNAAGNPHVTPLIDRFNEVRSAGKRINLADFGTVRTYSVEQALQDAHSFDGSTQLLQEMARSLGRLHNGKIDPITYGKIADMISDHRSDFSALTGEYLSDSQKRIDAVTSLMEEMAKDPEKLEKMKNMSTNNIKREIQNRAESLSRQQMQQKGAQA